MARSLSIILREADAAVELGVLSDLWKELRDNRKQYSLVELEYAAEHMEGLAREMARRDAALIKPLFEQLLGVRFKRKGDK